MVRCAIHAPSALPPSHAMISATLLAVVSCAVACAAAQQSALPPAAIAYTPQSAPCPATFVRSVDSKDGILSPRESAYITTRQEKVLPHAWGSYLSTVEQSARAHHLSLPKYLTDILKGHGRFPTLGIAASGGASRAAMFGGTVLSALDSRNTTSVAAGTGGLLQAASYLAGLSGGSWLVTSLVQADFPTIPTLIFGPEVNSSEDAFGGWLSQIGLSTVSTNTTVQEEFIESLIAEIAGKRAAGFPVTFTDVWARTLARHFTNGTTAANFLDTNLTHGAGETWSGIANL